MFRALLRTRAAGRGLAAVACAEVVRRIDTAGAVPGDPTFQLLPDAKVDHSAEDAITRAGLPLAVARHIAGAELTARITLGVLADLNPLATPPGNSVAYIETIMKLDTTGRAHKAAVAETKDAHGAVTAPAEPEVTQVDPPALLTSFNKTSLYHAFNQLGREARSAQRAGREKDGRGDTIAAELRQLITGSAEPGPLTWAFDVAGQLLLH